MDRLWTQTSQVHILLGGTSEKCIPLFCLISRLAKQDLEVCIEGPGEQESRPLREDCQVSKQLAAGRGGAEAMETQQRRRRKAKEPKAPRNEKAADRASCLSKGGVSLPLAPTGSQDNLVAGKSQALPTLPISPLHPRPHSTYLPTMIVLSL